MTLEAATGPEWDELQAQMQHDEPSCAGMPIYLQDTLNADEREFLADVCSTCPLLAACTAYKIAAQPRGGQWAVTRRPAPAKR